MTAEELTTILYRKMKAEQNTYRDWLLGLPPEEILDHAYEYSVREDIFAFAKANRDSGQLQFLLRRQRPVSENKVDFIFCQHIIQGGFPFHFICPAEEVVCGDLQSICKTHQCLVLWLAFSGFVKADFLMAATREAA